MSAPQDAALDVKDPRWAEIVKLYKNAKQSEKLNPIDYAIKIMQEYHFKTFIDTGEILIYQNGLYTKFGEQLIREHASTLLGNQASKHRKNEIVDHIKTSTYVYRDEFDKDIDIINVKNGLLNIKTKELKPHTPEYASITRIPIKYDLDADCPAIRQFFSEVLHTEDIAAIEEMIGYCLYRTYEIEKAFIFEGEGANGKSTLLRVITYLLGKDNCAAIDLQAIDQNRFALANLFGKLANISADISDQTLTNTNKFKQITGKDLIDAEFKGQNSFRYYNHAKLVFSCNKLPPTWDDSDAFFRRIRIFNFPNQFLNTKDDKDLISKLTTEQELSGLLNIALKGLERLFKNGEFTNQKSIEETRILYQRLSDSVAAFIQDCCVIDSMESESKKVLYQVYSAYCHGNKLPCKTSDMFYKRIRKYVVVEDSRLSNDDDEREYSFIGIRLKRSNEHRDDEGWWSYTL